MGLSPIGRLGLTYYLYMTQITASASASASGSPSPLLSLFQLQPSPIQEANTRTMRWPSASLSIPVARCTEACRRSLHNGPDTFQELLERHVVKKDTSLDEEEEELLARRRLTSTRREALSLYRDIFRASRFFMWPDSRGVLWRDVLRENARKEFEEARLEKDPEIVTRLLIGGRDAVDSALEKLAEKQRQQIHKDDGQH